MTQHHTMKLYETPFTRVECDEKLLELRLFDEKRQKIKVGDTITFQHFKTPEKSVTVQVTGLLNYKTFHDLIQDIPMRLLGYAESQRQWLLENVYGDIYTPEQEEKYGVLGIRLKRI